MRVGILVLVGGLLAGTLPAEAQGFQKVGTLTIAFEVRSQNPGAPLDWFVQRAPGLDDLALTGVPHCLDRLIVDAADEILRDRPEISVTGFCNELNQDFPQRVVLNCNPGFGMPPTDASGTTGEKPVDVHFKVDGDDFCAPSEPTTLERLELYLNSGDADSARTCRDAPDESSTIAELAQRFDVAPDRDGVDVHVCGDDAERQELFKTAIGALRLIDRQGSLIPGQPIPETSQISALASDLRSYFLGASIVIGEHEQLGASVWQVVVSALRRLDGVEIEVKTPTQAGSDPPPKVLEKNQEIRKRLIEELGLSQAGSATMKLAVGSFLDRESLDEALRTLREQRAVLDLAEFKLPGPDNGHVLTVVVERRAWVADVLLSAALAYDVEDRLTGNFLLEETNLLRTGETLKVSWQGGEELEEARLEAAWDWSRKQTQADLSIHGWHVEDQRQKLGVGQEARETRQGARLRFRLDHDNFTFRDFIQRAQAVEKERKRLRATTHLTVSVEAGQEELEPDAENEAGSDVDQVDVQVDKLAVELTEILSFDLVRGDSAGGLGALDLRLQARAEIAEDILGGETDFEQYRYDVSAQLFFGARSRFDFFVRYQTGVATSRGGVPEFERFRLGGSEFLRGFEEGEVLADNVGFDRTEFGVSLGYLVEALSKNQDDGERGAEAAAMPGIDLSNVYLKIFYDRAQISDSSSISDLLDFDGGLEGYGLSLELRDLPLEIGRGNLAIGYARSPDSVTHDSGTLFTTLSWNF